MSQTTFEHSGTQRHENDKAELLREAYTMALYVAICLLAALFAVSEPAEHADGDALKIVWGTTVGLALAHWFAFSVSARLAAHGAIDRHDAAVAVAQVVGAVVVALLATVPVLCLPVSAEFDVARLALAAFISLVGYAVARGRGAGRARSIIYAASMLVIATAVAIVKNVLVGH